MAEEKVKVVGEFDASRIKSGAQQASNSIKDGAKSAQNAVRSLNSDLQKSASEIKQVGKSFESTTEKSIDMLSKIGKGSYASSLLRQTGNGASRISSYLGASEDTQNAIQYAGYGAGIGAQIGMLFGPIGAGLGAAVGSLGGAAVSLLNASKALEEASEKLAVANEKRATSNIASYAERRTSEKFSSRVLGYSEVGMKALSENNMEAFGTNNAKLQAEIDASAEKLAGIESNIDTTAQKIASTSASGRDGDTLEVLNNSYEKLDKERRQEEERLEKLSTASKLLNKELDRFQEAEAKAAEATKTAEAKAAENARRSEEKAAENARRSEEKEKENIKSNLTEILNNAESNAKSVKLTDSLTTIGGAKGYSTQMAGVGDYYNTIRESIKRNLENTTTISKLIANYLPKLLEKLETTSTSSSSIWS